MTIVTLEQLKEVYGRRSRPQKFEDYVDVFVQELKAIKQDDGTYLLNSKLGEYVWQAAWETRTPEDYKKRIQGIKEIYHIITDLEKCTPYENEPNKYHVTEEAIREEITLEVPEENIREN